MHARFDLPTEQTTVDIASRVAQHLTPSLVIVFRGNIGAGKTTFIRAMLRALGEQGAVKSPTFSLVESYQFDDMSFHHFDLYRIEDESELACLGFRDYFSPCSVCCIEWPERAGRLLAEPDVDVMLTTKNGQNGCDTSSEINQTVLNRTPSMMRHVRLEALTSQGINLLKGLGD